MNEPSVYLILSASWQVLIKIINNRTLLFPKINRWKLFRLYYVGIGGGTKFHSFPTSFIIIDSLFLSLGVSKRNWKMANVPKQLEENSIEIHPFDISNS